MGFIANCRADIRRSWVRLVQTINGIAVSLAGGALIVNQSYPDTFRTIVAELPHHYQLAALFGFGFVVHFALQQAAKPATPAPPPGPSA